MLSIRHVVPGAFIALIGLISGLLPHVAAQNPGGYPEWVTNDYNCVIGCLKIFNETVKERPYPAGESQAYNCVTTTCNKETMAMNIYQTQYIISMFYATGSIYEDPNMGTWTSVPNFFGSSSTSAGPAGASTTTANATSTQAETLTTTNAAGQAQTTTRLVGAPIASTSSPVASGQPGAGGNGTDLNGSAGASSGAVHSSVVAAWALAAAVALSVTLTGEALSSS